jgi:hypothetical protein
MPLFSPVAVPIINGVGWSFGHIKGRIADVEFTGGFKSIKYSRKRTREKAMSNHPDPVFKTLGENAYDCSAEVYLEWWRATINQIQSQLGAGYGDQFFTVYVSYGPARGFDIITDTILGCTFDSTEADNSQGPGPLTRVIDFQPMKILYNGLDDLEVPLQPSGS